VVSLGVRFLLEVRFGLFGFQKMTPDRFSKITETDQFRFGFYFGFSVKTEKTDGIKQETANRFQN
jgi:2-oxo-4-hydroxy-4-carboxy--5-ureidoimidazoline (OHCU) decarboxylase